MHLQVCFDCCRGSCSVIAGSCLVAQWYLRIPDFFGKRHDSPALSFLGWLALDGLQVMGWCCNWQREGPSVPPCLSWNLGITLKLWHEKKLPTNRPDSFSFFFHPSDFRKSMSTNSSQFNVFSFGSFDQLNIRLKISNWDPNNVKHRKCGDGLPFLPQSWFSGK